MLADNDLVSPAQVGFQPLDAAPDAAPDWSKAQGFGSLREAVHWTMTHEAPAGTHAVIRASSGAVLDRSHLEEIWSSLQGP